MVDHLQNQLPLLVPRLWRFALRLTRHSDDAEDLVQRTCVRALERRTQWQPGSNLLSWLFAIEHSIWMNELRSAQRRRTASLDSDTATALLDDTPSVGGDPELHLHYTQVVAAVESLPEAQRVVLVLVAVEGLSYREAADVLDIPIGTVMSRLARARCSVGQMFKSDAPFQNQENPRHERR